MFSQIGPKMLLLFVSSQLKLSKNILQNINVNAIFECFWLIYKTLS